MLSIARLRRGKNSPAIFCLFMLSSHYLHSGGVGAGAGVIVGSTAPINDDVGVNF